MEEDGLETTHRLCVWEFRTGWFKTPGSSRGAVRLATVMIWETALQHPWFNVLDVQLLMRLYMTTDLNERR